MSELAYSLIVTVTAYYRGFKVGQQHPREQRDFILFGIISLALVALLVIYRPLPALFLFVLPMILGLFMTSWATYEHHAGLKTNDDLAASFNNLNKWYNLFTGNLGYHTAHHYKQGLHWSKLPDLHGKIAHQIPTHLIRQSWV